MQFVRHVCDGSQLSSSTELQKIMYVMFSKVSVDATAMLSLSLQTIILDLASRIFIFY